MVTIKYKYNYSNLSDLNTPRVGTLTVAGKIIEETPEEIKFLAIEYPNTWREQKTIHPIKRINILSIKGKNEN